MRDLESALLRSGAPVPRYPFFSHPSSRNWFRTTINPLVWSLVPDRFLPVDSKLLVRAHELEKSGIIIDTWRWAVLDAPEIEGRLDKRVRYWPVSLFAPHVTLELFALLTSGRTTDLNLAKDALGSLCTRHAGAAPDRRRTPDGGWETTWGQPKRTRRGREHLTADLKQQLGIWKLVQESQDKPTVALRRAAKLVGISVTGAGNHYQALCEYEEFLAADTPLRQAVQELGWKGSRRPRAIAMRSLREAVRWLTAR